MRSRAHPSLLYWGASLAALQDLADAKGYTFLGCNGNGNNAYFLRNELAVLPCIAGLERKFQRATFAEYVVDGRRVRGEQALDIIRGLPVINVRTGATEAL